MSLDAYFQALIKRVEESEIGNLGTDKNGFFKPTRTVLLRHLNLLKDLHGKPRAQAMVRTAWAHVVEDLPPAWPPLTQSKKAELKKLLGEYPRRYRLLSRTPLRQRAPIGA